MIEESDYKLRLKINKKSDNNTIILQPGKNEINSYLKIEGDYEGVEIKSDAITKEGKTQTKNNTNSSKDSKEEIVITERDVSVVDRLHPLTIKNEELQAINFEYIDTQD